MSCRIRPFREKHYWFLTNLDFTPEVPAFNSRLKNVTLLTLGRRFPHISLISASSRPPMWRHTHRSGRKKTPLKVVFFVLVMKKGFYPLIYLVTRHHLKKTYIPDLSSPLNTQRIHLSAQLKTNKVIDKYLLFSTKITFRSIKCDFFLFSDL
jgi:hypothetical protein